MKRALSATVLYSAILFSGGSLPAQRPSRASRPLRVFVDCNTMGCDLDYFRTEIPYIDYVRDRTDASLHVLVSTLQTGSGGTEHTVTFIGLKDFAGITDTLGKH